MTKPTVSAADPGLPRIPPEGGPLTPAVLHRVMSSPAAAHMLSGIRKLMSLELSPDELAGVRELLDILTDEESATGVGGLPMGTPQFDPSSSRTANQEQPE